MRKIIMVSYMRKRARLFQVSNRGMEGLNKKVTNKKNMMNLEINKKKGSHHLHNLDLLFKIIMNSLKIH
jgi:hypothetical protein